MSYIACNIWASAFPRKPMLAGWAKPDLDQATAMMAQDLIMILPIAILPLWRGTSCIWLVCCRKWAAFQPTATNVVSGMPGLDLILVTLSTASLLYVKSNLG